MNHTSQWQELHNQLQLELSLTPSSNLRKIFVTCIFLSPLAGILYALSVIKRISETSERWLIRKNPSGFIYPNTCVLIPVWAILYTIANVISLIMSQINSTKKSPRAPPLHVAIELVKYSLFLGMIWSTVYAIPRSKFQLQKNQSKFSSSRQDRCLIYIAPIIFNIIIGLGYLVPLSLSGLMCVWTLSSMHHVAKIWHQFETSHDLILDATVDQHTKDEQISSGLKYLHLMQHYRKTLKMNMRLIAFVYITITAIVSIILLISTFIILKALFFQLKIYKRLAINSIRRSPEILTLNQSLNYRNIQSIHSTTTQPQINHANQLQTDSMPRKSKSSHCGDHQLYHQEIDLKESVLDWFPSFKRGTGIDEKMWKLELHNDTQNSTANVNGSIPQDSNLRKYRILKRYIVNTIWQQVLILIVILSFIIMHILVESFHMKNNSLNLDQIFLVVTLWCKNENALPFTQIYLIVVEWANLTWNLGLGAGLGLISCIVAFTPSPQTQNRGNRTDDDF
ncbi:uncharacterized protein MELLADRAFT_108357 [Melampsora larici-populina 98AG31]|uniref:Uncharacterized protein n=1 Tax=Melampsora larici-populina (strain 98AG31 / pathotype 3-4-7) TaxID=747676 RepID=F4RSU8_MELLP|nr:uncharacterized protein MELLADRAFT_108357 [Melampsora larici-populina 98AG31]EGG04394.1 hypothetical protein MELLADRAFT_108357 [Melampsora larici-populina 98AG31]